MLGDQHAADYGGCWRYVSSYAERNNVAPIRVCEQLLSRTCEAVALILNAASELECQPANTDSGVAA